MFKHENDDLCVEVSDEIQYQLSKRARSMGMTGDEVSKNVRGWVLGEAAEKLRRREQAAQILEAMPRLTEILRKDPDDWDIQSLREEFSVTLHIPIAVPPRFEFPDGDSTNDDKWRQRARVEIGRSLAEAALLMSIYLKQAEEPGWLIKVKDEVAA